jgi:hypothetical protein
MHAYIGTREVREGEAYRERGRAEKGRKRECGIIYRKLERTHDDSQSDEYLEEHMEANEAEFEVDEVRGELKVTAII